MSSTTSLIVGGFADGDTVTRVGGSTGAKSDTQALEKRGVGVHINVDGTIALKDPEGRTGNFTVKAGSSFAYAVNQVLSTGTSLANDEFVILYGPSSK